MPLSLLMATVYVLAAIYRSSRLMNNNDYSHKYVLPHTNMCYQTPHYVASTYEIGQHDLIILDYC